MTTKPSESFPSKSAQIEKAKVPAATGVAAGITFAERIKKSFKEKILSVTPTPAREENESETIPKSLGPEMKLECLSPEIISQIKFHDEDGKLYRRIFVENLGWVSAKKVKELAEAQGIPIN